MVFVRTELNFLRFLSLYELLKTSQDRKRMSQQLDDVQKEFGLLLEDNKKLEEIKMELQSEVDEMKVKMEEVEKKDEQSKQVGGCEQ